MDWYYITTDDGCYVTYAITEIDSEPEFVTNKIPDRLLVLTKEECQYLVNQINIGNCMISMPIGENKRNIVCFSWVPTATELFIHKLLN